MYLKSFLGCSEFQKQNAELELTELSEVVNSYKEEFQMNL